jgi:Uma2 family endonuclease
MANVMKSAARRTLAAKPTLPPLKNGDRLDQKTFHERYEAMPEHVRAELIGGIVYMASPQKLPHGRSTWTVGRWLGAYEDATPGTEVLPGVTNIMGPKSEPEPDQCLLILPACGGQTTEDDKGYLCGAPELIVESSLTTESRDLRQKKNDYEKAGVREYVVVALRSQKIFWFALRSGKFEDMKPDADGIYRSRVFPGLWLDAEALLRRDRKKLLAVLRKGLRTPEHRAFVAKRAAHRSEEK